MLAFIARIVLVLNPIATQKVAFDALAEVDKQDIRAGWRQAYAAVVPAAAGLLASDIARLFDKWSIGNRDAPPKRHFLVPLPQADTAGALAVWHPCLPRPCHVGMQGLNATTDGSTLSPVTFDFAHGGQTWTLAVRYEFRMSGHARGPHVTP